ncbi:hypothetical protein, partial [Actinotignum urinale]|uniref:hypothetical protein n=1 Tax=Actinotignum urinale TaxID=190146 RepID=UPI00280BD15A
RSQQPRSQQPRSQQPRSQPARFTTSVPAPMCAKLTMLFHMRAESASLFHICAKSASLPHMLSVADVMATRAGHVITREITEDSNDYGTVP